MEPLATWLYGSHSRCDCVLTGQEVSPQHCLLAQYAEGWAIEDLESAGGTWLNGVRLTPRVPAWVTAGDQVLLGRFTRMPWPSELSTVQAHVSSSGENAANYSPANGEIRTISVGRGPENDVVLDYPVVSWNHARLTVDSSGWMRVEDLGSTNGTSINHKSNQIRTADIQATDVLYFGSFKIPVARLVGSRKLVLGAAAEQATINLAEKPLIVGRDPACDIHVDSPLVSWHHARLVKGPDGIAIEELDSRNGTFVQGARITRKTTLRRGSEVHLGSVRLRLVDDTGRLEQQDFSGNVTIEASAITVNVGRGGKNRRLLDPVSLTIFPSELVALMGLAGAGKTTLMKALNGYTAPSQGRVLFNGDDLYLNHDQYRLQIGYVPQDDILHPQLTVREALRYTARLRTDLLPHEIENRITSVLKDLGIEDIGNRLIGSPERKVISGGQRKRVNIAMELLSDPSVLFLDEPTSGLSSYDAHQVILLLRKLANSGKTIVCTIHQPSLDIFKEFDSLIMVARDKGETPGALAYYGPAFPDSIEFFSDRRRTSGMVQPLSPESLMSGLASRPASEWTANYKRSSIHRDFVDSRSGRASVQASPATKAAGLKLSLGIRQFLTLTQRTLLLKLRDRTQLLVLLAQAPLFAALLSIVFNGLKDQHFTDPSEWAGFCSKIVSTHFLTVVAGVWFGCNNAARDIVGETAIFLRERMINLKLPWYVLSKLTVLGLTCLVQCAALLGIVYYACGLSGDFVVLFGILLMSSLVGATLGLLISALSPTTEAAIAFLPIVLLPFILLGGGIKPISEMPRSAQAIASVCPTRWAFEAALLEEARKRKATFKNTLAEDLLKCKSAVGQCEGRLASIAGRKAPPAGRAEAEVETQSDIASAAFPLSSGRTSLGRSFQVLAMTLVTCGVLLLMTLDAKKQN